MKLLRNTNKKKRGAALVEYGLLIAGVALICAAAVSLFGHKTNDLLGTVASILPSADVEDSGPINSGKLINVAEVDGGLGLDWANLNATTEDSFGAGAGAVINDTSQPGS
jgi:pilus assembly protein Flp/PilA